jgi:predicted acetylornithine/succinylornithine family transaminase
VTDHQINTYKRWPVTFVSGSGALLFDAEGRSYLDFVAGIAVASVGHAHARVVEAIWRQASELIHVSNLYGTEPQAALAERLAELTGGMQSFFCNSGAEAIECALKLVRKWAVVNDRPGHRVVAASGGFHGRTFGALAATGQPSKQKAFAPMLEGFTHVPFGDPDALAVALGADVAAVLLEPIQGEAGIVVPPPDYLQTARALCDEHGILLVLDEVQTGIGRTGAWFAHDEARVEPDIMCLAKGLASGLPIGACLATPEVSAAFEPGDHATTFGGGPVQCAAALAVLDVIQEENLLERARSSGAELVAGLDKIFGGRAEVRGAGLMVGVEFPEPIAHSIAAAALEHRLLVNDATPSVVRLTPPLVVTGDDVHAALEILEEVAGEI